MVTVDPAHRDWTTRASCRGRTDLFFAPDRSAQAVAVGICQTCPVRPECLDDVRATEHSPWRFGVVAAMTPAERRRWTGDS